MNKSILLYAALSVCLTAGCAGEKIEIVGNSGADPDIYPDYKNITIPPNIAPLNFNIIGDEGEYAAIFSCGDDMFTVKAEKGLVNIPAKQWRNMLAGHCGDTISVTVCMNDNGQWIADKPFDMQVSNDSIDNTLVYRLIPPGYGVWMEMGIYQRDLESYEQTEIYSNDSHYGNCVNCHSFCRQNPDMMLFHMRAQGAATYMTENGLKHRLDTKTDDNVSNFTYPYWHPSGRYAAFSVNNIFQVFHTADPDRIEVIDDKSDVVVYDITANESITSPLIHSEGNLETFPAFSPDGKTLYFCTAMLPDSLPEKYREVHYSLCAIGFDADTRRFGEHVDTLLDVTKGVMAGRSVSFPRPSPDGRRLIATVSRYGNFSIWHKSADLWMLDAETGEWTPMDKVNSEDVESYHSWSSNGHWVVFSSRRDDGLYTRPYFTHIDEDGSFTRPFMLPQKNPREFYQEQMNSYNIPELVTGKVGLDTKEVTDWIGQPITKVK